MRAMFRTAAWLLAASALSILIYWPMTLRAQSIGGGGGATVTLTPTATTGSVSATGGILLTPLGMPVNGTFSTACTGGTLTDSTTYYYRVTAINLVGETLASTETSKATGACSGANTSTVTVTWAAITGATGYNVYGRTTGAETEITLGTGVTSLSYADTGSALSGALPTVNSTAYVIAAATKALTLSGNVASSGSPALILDNAAAQSGFKTFLSLREAGTQFSYFVQTAAGFAGWVLDSSGNGQIEETSAGQIESFDGTTAGGGTTAFLQSSTNTKSTGLLYDLQNNGTTEFNVDFAGNGTFHGALTTGTPTHVTSVSEHDFSAYNAANLAGGTAFARTAVTNASTLTADSTITHDIAGTGTGTFVAKLCSDGVTCGAGNVYLTCTAGANCATAAAGRIDACTVTKAAVAAATTLTWSVTTACGTTDPGINAVAHFTTP